MKNPQFISLSKLLLEDTEEAKKIKTIYMREDEYLWILGPIEYTVALFYLENKKIKDKDVRNALKNIRYSPDNELEHFKEPIEKEIMQTISGALQVRRITRHELWLLLGHIIWAIDNREILHYSRAYLDWILNFFKLNLPEEKRQLERRYDELGERLGIDKKRIEVMKGNVQEIELSEEENEAATRESAYFAMPDDEKYEYLLTCEEERDCEFSNFGMELEKKGEFEKAEKLYKRELEMYPESHSGDENLGRLYKEMGKIELAEQHLKKALELAMKQKEEEPNSIDDEVIDDLRKNLEEVKKAK